MIKYNKGADAVLALVGGDIDAVIIDNQPAKVFVEQNAGLEILPTEYAVEEYAIAVKKGNTELLDQINGALEALIADGTVDAIVTDHAPHAAWEKAREFELAPFGMTGLETSLGLVLTNLVEPGVIGLSDMVDLMAVAPRDILGLEPVKIAEGSVADITVFDPSVEWTVAADDFCSKAHNSGFVGFALKGRATDVFVGGEATLCDGAIVE